MTLTESSSDAVLCVQVEYPCVGILVGATLCALLHYCVQTVTFTESSSDAVFCVQVQCSCADILVGVHPRDLDVTCQSDGALHRQMWPCC